MVGATVVVDDASPCTYDGILRDIGDAATAGLVRFDRNAGIARSLNVGLDLAHRRGASWLLTLDQDSSFAGTYVQNLHSDLVRAREHDKNVGAIAPQFVDDKSGVISYPANMDRGWPATEEVIQSGSLWSVPALWSLHGFDERLALDGVDSAACLSLREAGYWIALSPTVRLHHVWGDARTFSVFGHQVASTGHSAERRQRIARNRLSLFRREWKQSPRHALRTMRRVGTATVLAGVAESDGAAKVRASLAGLLGRNP